MAQNIRLHSHFALAKSFQGLPRHMNPVINPAAMKALPPHLQAPAAAVAAHPELAAVASGVSDGSSDGGSNQLTNSPTGGSGASFASADGSLIPNQTQFKRLPSVRHNLCGFQANVFAGAGTQTSTARPQVRFKANRLVIPSSTAANTYISNMLVGAKPQYAASSQEPTDMFEEQSTGAVWDMDVCEIGQIITMSVTAPGAATIYATLVGEALDGRPYPMLRSPLKRIGFTANNGATIAAGASFNVIITPQVRFKTRKVVLDDATAKFFIITSLQVGINPQFMSGDPVPAAAFTEVAQDMWLDLDEAYIGNVISVQITNIDAAAHVFQGALSGDVDPRDMSTFSGNSSSYS